MKRIIISACLLALVVCLAVPAFAASWMRFLYAADLYAGTYDNQYYSYNRYDIPHSNTNWWFDGKTPAGELDWTNTSVSTNRTLLFRYYPFGNVYYFDFSDVSPLPTSLTLSVPIDLTLSYTDGTVSAPVFNMVPMVGYIDANGNDLGYYSFGATAYTGQSNYVLSGSVTVPENAVAFSLTIAMNIPVKNVVRIRTGMTPVQKPVTVRIHQPFAPVAQVIDPFESGKVSINGDTEEVTFSTLHKELFWSTTPNSFSASGSKFVFEFPMYQTQGEDVFAFLLGKYGFISTDSFDFASQLSSSFTMSVQFANQTADLGVTCRLVAHFFDDNFVQLRTDSAASLDRQAVVVSGGNPVSIPLSGSISSELLKNASYFRLVMEMDIEGSSVDGVVVTVNLQSSESTITVPFSALGQMSSQGRLTNKKLDEIQDAIAGPGGTNDKLDEIINGNVDGKPPAGSDLVDDLEDQESSIRDDASNQFGEAEDFQASALDVIFMYAGAFSAFSLIFDAFTSIPLFAGLLYVSVAIGIFSFILGLSLDAAGADHEAQRDYQRRKNRRTIRRSRGKAY